MEKLKEKWKKIGTSPFLTLSRQDFAPLVHKNKKDKWKYQAKSKREGNKTNKTKSLSSFNSN